MASDTTTLSAVLWDMDGTLIDSEPIWMRCQEALVAEAGGTWSHSDSLALVGSDMDATAAALQHAGVPLTVGQIAERLTAEVIDALRRRVEWRPGAAELVAAVRDAGIPQALVTTSPRKLARLVVEALPSGTFSAVVTGDDVQRGKPDPEPYLTAARALGVDPAACVAIEDSPAGLASAVAAGTAAIGVPHDTVLAEGDRWTLLTSLRGVGVEHLVRIRQRRVDRRMR